VEKIDIKENGKCRVIIGNYDCHVDVALRCGAHCLMEHIQGFTRSHWMPQLGECLHRIALATAKVINIE
jgi:hypothetical protein